MKRGRKKEKNNKWKAFVPMGIVTKNLTALFIQTKIHETNCNGIRLFFLSLSHFESLQSNNNSMESFIIHV